MLLGVPPPKDFWTKIMRGLVRVNPKCRLKNRHMTRHLWYKISFQSNRPHKPSQSKVVKHSVSSRRNIISLLFTGWILPALRMWAWMSPWREVFPDQCKRDSVISAAQVAMYVCFSHSSVFNVPPEIDISSPSTEPLSALFAAIGRGPNPIKLFFKRFYLFTFRQRGREEEREDEKH